MSLNSLEHILTQSNLLFLNCMYLFLNTLSNLNIVFFSLSTVLILHDSTLLPLGNKKGKGNGDPVISLTSWTRMT